MKVKTSITLPEEVLARIDQLDNNRSGFLERAARFYLSRLDRIRSDERDAEIYARNHESLNAEAMDVLAYQVIPE